YLAIAAAAMGDRERAQFHVARAIEAAQRLGAPALVQRIRQESLSLAQSVSTQPAGPEVSEGENVFRRAGDVWTVRFRRHSIQLRDSKGLQDLAQLLVRPGVHIAALDLASADGPRVDTDAGEVLDAAARDAYRRRLIELEEEASEADAAGDIGR